MKKLFSGIIIILFAIGLIGCNVEDENLNNNGEHQQNVKILEWSNNTAVYARIKKKYRNNVYNEIEDIFKGYEYKEIYIVEKYYDYDATINYKLLFLLKDDDHEKFINLISQNEMVEIAYKCEDIPFEGYDNRKLVSKSNTIKVGEELQISIEGDFKIYHQEFIYSGLWIKLADFDWDKDYSKEDFPNIDINSVKKYSFRKDSLFLELSKQDYFNLMYTSNVLSRMININEVNFVYSNTVMPIWESSDSSVVKIKNEFNNSKQIEIIGLKPGKATITFDWLSCEITVLDGE